MSQIFWLLHEIDAENHFYKLTENEFTTLTAEEFGANWPVHDTPSSK